MPRLVYLLPALRKEHSELCRNGLVQLAKHARSVLGWVLLREVCVWWASVLHTALDSCPNAFNKCKVWTQVGYNQWEVTVLGLLDCAVLTVLCHRCSAVLLPLFSVQMSPAASPRAPNSYPMGCALSFLALVWSWATSLVSFMLLHMYLGSPEGEKKPIWGSKVTCLLSLSSFH